MHYSERPCTENFSSEMHPQEHVSVFHISGIDHHTPNTPLRVHSPLNQVNRLAQSLCSYLKLLLFVTPAEQHIDCIFILLISQACFKFLRVPLFWCCNKLPRYFCNLWWMPPVIVCQMFCSLETNAKSDSQAITHTNKMWHVFISNCSFIVLEKKIHQVPPQSLSESQRKIQASGFIIKSWQQTHNPNLLKGTKWFSVIWPQSNKRWHLWAQTMLQRVFSFTRVKW